MCAYMKAFCGTMAGRDNCERVHWALEDSAGDTTNLSCCSDDRVRCGNEEIEEIHAILNPIRDTCDVPYYVNPPATSMLAWLRWCAID